MTEETPPAPAGLTPEHQLLTEKAGKWDVDCTFHMGGPEPMQLKATEVVEAFGPYFTRSVFEADMFGMPFKGCASIGFEPKSGEYVSTWFDSMTPQLFFFRGGYDADGKVLTLRGEGTDFHSGMPAKYHTTETQADDGSRTFKMFMNMEGVPEMHLFTHVYRRAD